jgi:uncharacterized protein YbjQ (UPF0145 family)
VSEERQLELVAQELKNRIGQIVSQYEEQLAAVKAEAITLLEQKDAELKELRDVSQETD